MQHYLTHNFSIAGLGLIMLTSQFSFNGEVKYSQFSANPSPAERKIVVFKESVSRDDRLATLENVGAKPIKRLERALWADVAMLNAGQIEHLKARPEIARIDDDIFLYTQAQTIPWGINTVDADLVWPSGNSGVGIKVGVIDTGISTMHSDLKANLKGGVNTIYSWQNYSDNNGHGSHVAGTIAAINNTVGVIGIAPKVHLYSIKALGTNGSGYLSDIIQGMDWAIANNMRIINMSLGTSSNNASLKDAVARVHAAGIVQVAAAGNNGGAVSYPAAYDEVIAVSAVDSSLSLASWSNRGPEVDLTAPGVSIYSTYKNTSYATMSGTSMASPHVAGAAALVLATAPGSYDTDADGVWDPTEVKAKLQSKATDIGASGFDTLYGWGLVNAYQATQ